MNIGVGYVVNMLYMNMTLIAFNDKLEFKSFENELFT
jgi:hypothetical protein